MLAVPGTPVGPAGASMPAGAPPGRGQALWWLALAACGSTLLLAITNHISRNVAPVPLLWVVPLALYLLTFILCFERDGFYHRGVFLRLLVLALSGMALALALREQNASAKVLLPLFCAALFVCCTFCHGELARSRPHPHYLTGFYLMVAAGGALGGLFVGLLAPHLFPADYELPCGMVVCAVLAALAVRPERGRSPAFLLLGAFAVALTICLGAVEFSFARSARVSARSFYGCLRTSEGRNRAAGGRIRTLRHGTIIHGRQFTDPERRRTPISYYGPASGIALAIREAQRHPSLHVGVVGLGTGTLAAFGRPGDLHRFYEIDPLVTRLAYAEFWYLRDCRAAVEIVPGDARLSLEREPPREYDVLAIDAFSSDAIPVHLLTREAFALYFRHLKPEGVLAVHVSNRYLELAPVVQRAAAAQGRPARRVKNAADPARAIYPSDWVLVAGRRGFFDQAGIRDAIRPIADRPGLRLWTDDYSNLLQVLR